MNDTPTPPNTPVDHQQLQKELDYRFTNEELLIEALRHSSFVNEQPNNQMRDNERLEFLGDAVLNLVIGNLLMVSYPHLREGELSRIRANLVNEAQLAEIARSIELGSYLLLGKGETQTGGHDKSSILANATEALIAAVYLDSGFEAAFRLIESQFSLLIDEALDVNSGLDYKSRLQEAVQSKNKTMPRYRLVEAVGPDHDKTFCISVSIGEIQAEGNGKSKKQAEQDAARKALDLLDL